MSNIEIKNAEGAKAGELTLNDAVYGIEPNIAVMHQVVTCQRASMRQGTHSTKGRHDVSGGGRKPYRQKGTGRARQGSIRAAQWTGGGVVFGPTPRSHARRTNAKEVKLAMRSALSGKLADNELIVLENYDNFEKPSTKQAAAVLKALNVADQRVTVVVPDDAIDAFLSFRNIPKVLVLGQSECTTYDLVDNKALIMSASVAQFFGEVLA